MYSTEGRLAHVTADAKSTAKQPNVPLGHPSKDPDAPAPLRQAPSEEPAEPSQGGASGFGPDVPPDVIESLEAHKEAEKALGARARSRGEPRLTFDRIDSKFASRLGMTKIEYQLRRQLILLREKQGLQRVSDQQVLEALKAEVSPAGLPPHRHAAAAKPERNSKRPCLLSPWLSCGTLCRRTSSLVTWNS